MQDSLGSRLRFARESKGLTISELAAKVRVREVLLKHIEKDEFEKVGADVYVRGHIRVMAQVLDLDPDELMALYVSSKSGESPFDQPGLISPEIEILEVASVVSEQQNSSLQLSGSFFEPVENFRAKSGTNWSLIMASTLGVIALIAIGSTVISTVNAPQEIIAESTPTPIPVKTDPAENLIAAAPAPGVDVLIQAENNSSWVRATDLNNVELFEGIIREGQEQRVGSVEGVKLLIGNAGAINLTVNGQVLGKAGGNGEVIRVEFGPEGPVQ
jgi:cytoskeleton protein RodZ